MICGSWIFHKINSVHVHVCVCLSLSLLSLYVKIRADSTVKYDLKQKKKLLQNWWNAFYKWHSNVSEKKFVQRKFYLVWLSLQRQHWQITTATIIMDKLVMPILIVMLTLPYTNQSLNLGLLSIYVRSFVQIVCMIVCFLRLATICLSFV